MKRTDWSRASIDWFGGDGQASEGSGTGFQPSGETEGNLEKMKTKQS